VSRSISWWLLCLCNWIVLLCYIVIESCKVLCIVSRWPSLADWAGFPPLQLAQIDLKLLNSRSIFLKQTQSDKDAIHWLLSGLAMQSHCRYHWHCSLCWCWFHYFTLLAILRLWQTVCCWLILCSLLYMFRSLRYMLRLSVTLMCIHHYLSSFRIMRIHIYDILCQILSSCSDLCCECWVKCIWLVNFLYCKVVNV